MGPGENAGAVDVGGGLVCAFKVESHNHPSAVEPFQGAATGVGGHPARHLRDRRAADRGARLAALRRAGRRGAARALPARRARSRGSATTATRSACPRSAARSTSRAPTSTTASSTRWRSGSRAREQLVRSAAAGPGNLLVLFGASTGRDGIGGASVLASRRARRRGRARTSAPPSRSATRSRRRSCSSARSSCSSGACSSSLQDLGAAGLTSSASEMASKGEVGIDIDVASVPLREPDMEPFEIMVSESQERMLCVVEPANARRGARAVREVGGRRRRDRRRSPTAGRCACCATASSSATCRCAALVDDCPLYDLEPAQARAAALPAAAGDAGGRREPARDAAGAAREPEHRLAPAAVRAVRLDRAVAHRAPPRAGRRGRARARRRQRAGRQHRRQRPPRRRGPLPRHDRGGARVRVEPRLRRRRAARHDQQPQLRQPREAAHRLAADARRCAASARPAARCEAPIVGGNVSLYNEGADRPDLPDAGDRHGRDAARRAPAPGASAFAREGDADRAGRSVRALAGRERAREAARRGAARRAARDRHRGGRAPRSWPCARPCARGPLSSAHDIAEGGLAVALAECCLAGGSARGRRWASCRGRSRASAPVRRGPGRASWSAAPPQRARASWRDARPVRRDRHGRGRALRLGRWRVTRGRRARR